LSLATRVSVLLFRLFSIVEQARKSVTTFSRDFLIPCYLPSFSCMIPQLYSKQADMIPVLMKRKSTPLWIFSAKPF
jgi:hypothetical protein